MKLKIILFVIFFSPSIQYKLSFRPFLFYAGLMDEAKNGGKIMKTFNEIMEGEEGKKSERKMKEEKEKGIKGKFIDKYNDNNKKFFHDNKFNYNEYLINNNDESNYNDSGYDNDNENENSYIGVLSNKVGQGKYYNYHHQKLLQKKENKQSFYDFENYLMKEKFNKKKKEKNDDVAGEKVKEKRGYWQGFCLKRTRSGRKLPYICWRSSK